MRVAAVILAAGASRRLGRPKQLVRVGVGAGSETLLDRTLRVVHEAALHTAFVVLGAHADVIEAEAELDGAVIVRNAAWETGMASSIHAGMNAVRAQVSEVEAVMLLVCDQPRLTATHLGALMDAAAQGAIVASVYGGVPGVPAIFPKSAFAQLMELSGDAGARKLLQDEAVIGVAFDHGVIDVDTEEDLLRMQQDPAQG